MSATINYENFKVKQKVFCLTDTVKVECKTDAKLDSKIVSLTPFITCSKNEILNGQVKYTGRIIYSVLSQNDGVLNKSECATEFLGTIKSDDILPDFSASVDLEIIKTDHDVVNGFIVITTTITARVTFYKTTTQKYVCGGENVIVKSDMTSLSKEIYSKTSHTTVIEEFEVNNLLCEVIHHDEQAIITSVQCGVGCIIAEGEWSITLFALQKNEIFDILKETRVFPFRLEIECDNVTPTMRAVASAFVSGAKIDATSFEETGTTTVKAELSLTLCGNAYSFEELLIAVDAFSVSDELDVKKQEIVFSEPVAQLFFNERFCERVLIDELEPASKLVFAVCNKIKEISVLVESGTLKAEYAIDCTLYYKNNGDTFTVKTEFPIGIVENLPDGLVADEVVLSAVVCDFNAKAISLTEVETYGIVKLSAIFMQKKSIVALIDATVVGEKLPNDHAFSVYIPLAGEDLWTLSKRLSVSPDDLINTNPDLCFPLVGDERIVVYRQKTKEYS